MPCSGEEYFSWFLTSFLGFLLYALGIPLLLMWRVRLQLKELHLPHVKARIGFLYMGFERRCWYWEGIAMSRKVLLGVGLLVPYPRMKVLVLLGLSLSFMSMHLKNKP